MDQHCNVIQSYLKNHQKRETRIQWLLEEDEQKELYNDLGIIGEIASPDTGKSSLSYAAEQIRRASKCGNSLQNNKQFKFETPSTSDLNMDVKLKRAINRKQRKRSRHCSKLLHGLSHAKIGKMDLTDCDHSKSVVVKAISGAVFLTFCFFVIVLFSLSYCKLVFKLFVPTFTNL